ncbi:unnamed protein product [Phytomonas sp. Hart1]|nr:unnamed protein product [Phytomonas sp. Hart1]|eukprot:CCW66683.1 unnamed protein product [Phytomonas sp. isolate Hart1]
MLSAQDSMQEPPRLDAPAGVLYLDQFIESVLKVALQEELRQRDLFSSLASQCAQLRRLFHEMRGLSREQSFINASSSSPATNDSGAGKDINTHVNRTIISGRFRSKILVNFGNHFYTAAVVKDASRVRVNIGCGVILEMSVEAAETFLKKKEKLLREAAMRKTKEVLRLSYRVRVVSEAVARITKKNIGLLQN